LRTLGVDFAAQPANTAACLVEWRDGIAAILRIERPCDDERLRSLFAEADKVGIDVPLGWPDPFVRAVHAHHAGGPWPSETTSALCLRRTDLAVWKATGVRPLSVSTDRIGITAFRAASLLNLEAVDRLGAGRFVEVYPRVARLRFGIEASSAALLASAPWLRIPADAALAIDSSRHCLDAVIASLAARAAAVGLCEPVPAEERVLAAREGWIAVPTIDALGGLPQAA